jgi:hypothetical protein
MGLRRWDVPKKPTKGKAQVGVELPAELVAAARAYALKRGERFSAVMERALRREMAYPPPPVSPAPFPDADPPRKGRAGEPRGSR